jgi:hypothetical protein
VGTRGVAVVASMLPAESNVLNSSSVVASSAQSAPNPRLYPESTDYAEGKNYGSAGSLMCGANYGPGSGGSGSTGSQGSRAARSYFFAKFMWNSTTAWGTKGTCTKAPFVPIFVPCVDRSR